MYIQVSVCGGRRRPAAPRSRALSACGRVPRLMLPCSSQREGQEVESRRCCAALGLPLLFGLEFLSQDCRYLTLHKCPRHCRICQWTFLSARTVHLRSLLSLDRIPGAGKAELVVGLARALNEVCVFQALLAERALQQRGGRGRSRVGAVARLRRRHRRGRRHVPRARRPPPAI